MILRPATEADREFFWANRRDGFLPLVPDWEDPAMRAQADREFDELPVQIVEERGERIGYLCVLDRGDHLWLDEIVLVEAARGRGIGTALVEQVIADAEARAVPVRLGVLEHNPARRLYERLGFRVVHVDPPRLRMER
ncbi:MAG TPA: GNAT family N-acetyltransferase [Gaiellaceae bacterium]|nr:GNAT family N-acetyltransferase [Gaiellaceae bacterium]